LKPALVTMPVTRAIIATAVKEFHTDAEAARDECSQLKL
jgi:hypothetical protein